MLLWAAKKLFKIKEKRVVVGLAFSFGNKKSCCEKLVLVKVYAAQVISPASSIEGCSIISDLEEDR